MCHLTLFKMADGKSIDWEDDLFRDDAGKFQRLKVMMIMLFFIIHTVYLHVRYVSVNQCARGHTDSHASRKGVIVLLVADASLRLAHIKIDQERQQYMEGLSTA